MLTTGVSRIRRIQGLASSLLPPLFSNLIYVFRYIGPKLGCRAYEILSIHLLPQLFRVILVSLALVLAGVRRLEDIGRKDIARIFRCMPTKRPVSSPWS